MNTQVIFLSIGNAVKYDLQGVYKDLPDYM